MDDLIVVGAGLTGLLAATRLAMAGARVRVLEQAPDPGGRARSPRLQGRPVNLGPHALYARGPAARALEGLGLELEADRPSAAGTLGLRGGRLVELPTSAGALLRGVSPGLAASARVARWVMRAGTRPLAGLDARAWVQAELPGAAERELAEALLRLTTYAAALERLPAEAAARQLRVGLGGVRYLRGGWQRLVDQLLERARALGVTVRPGVRVEAVGPGEVRGPAGVERAETVVLAVPPARAEALLPGFSAGPLVPARAAVLDLVLRHLPCPGRRLALGLDQPLYASVHHRDGAGAVLHLAVYLRPGEPGAPHRERLEALADQLQPGWRGAPGEVRFLPELVVQHGLPVAPVRPLRAAPGVFLAGDWLGDGFLLDGVVASVERLLGTLGVRDSRAA